MKDHIIICGLGSIGFRTYTLLKKTGHQVVAISNMTEDEWRWQLEANEDLFLLGDARDDNLLIQADIKDAKAILTLTDNDMVNISIAMDARALNSTIKIIMRMHDHQLGKHIAHALGIHQVFSMPELVAPVFYGNTYHPIIAEFKKKGVSYFVSADLKSNLKESHLILKENHTNSANQKNTNNPTCLFAYNSSVHKKKKKFNFKIFRRFLYLKSPVFENFRLFLFILVCFIFTVAFFLSWAMSLSFVDAIYFVTTTVTTIGYGDFNFSNTGPLLKLFGCFLMLSGAAAIAVLFSSITEIILSKKLSSLVGGQPLPKANHVIVLGAGPIGQQIVSMLLKDEVPIVIVTGGLKDHYADDINRKVALVDGYLKSKDTLMRANIQTAKAIVVITDDDVENLSISLTAKKLNPKLMNIIHVFSPKLAEKLQFFLSLDRVLSTPEIVAPYFVAAVFGENISLALEWEGQLLYLSSEDALHANSISSIPLKQSSLPSPPLK